MDQLQQENRDLREEVSTLKDSLERLTDMMESMVAAQNQPPPPPPPQTPVRGPLFLRLSPRPSLWRLLLMFHNTQCLLVFPGVYLRALYQKAINHFLHFMKFQFLSFQLFNP